MFKVGDFIRYKNGLEKEVMVIMGIDNKDYNTLYIIGDIGFSKNKDGTIPFTKEFIDRTHELIEVSDYMRFLYGK